MTYSDVIIKRLSDLCKERHISVNKLATLSGLTQSTVENIMNGKTRNPKHKTLHRAFIQFRPYLGFPSDPHPPAME